MSNTVTLTSAPLGFRRYREDDFVFERGVAVEDVPDKVVQALKKVEGYEFDVSKSSSGGSAGGTNA